MLTAEQKHNMVVIETEMDCDGLITRYYAPWFTGGERGSTNNSLHYITVGDFEEAVWSTMSENSREYWQSDGFYNPFYNC